jgi:RAB protein geranylgeranyltransferase component A
MVPLKAAGCKSFSTRIYHIRRKKSAARLIQWVKNYRQDDAQAKVVI